MIISSLARGYATFKVLPDNNDSLFSGSKFEDFLFWVKRNDAFVSVNYDYKNRGRRQGRCPQCVENGSIYIFKPRVFRKQNNRIGDNFSLFPMKFWQTWQIDDIEVVEYYLEKKIKNQQKININDLELIVYDFDGVMTYNQVLVDQNGKESVSVGRSDGLAISEIKRLDIPQIIISTEKNEVVQKRAQKLDIPYAQGVNNKRYGLMEFTKKGGVKLSNGLGVSPPPLAAKYVSLLNV